MNGKNIVKIVTNIFHTVLIHKLKIMKHHSKKKAIKKKGLTIISTTKIFNSINIHIQYHANLIIKYTL